MSVDPQAVKRVGAALAARFPGLLGLLVRCCTKRRHVLAAFIQYPGCYSRSQPGFPAWRANPSGI
ncbi:hypothetical protein Pres01_10920 [Metapseudomonas resinovorans]|nr:hypothetical protein Pres01_10920 [Pseudomonas resinovorans]